MTAEEPSGLLVVDKPLGITSHDVVGRVRRALGMRRVGHAGTLDPDASGVLVVGVGQATKLLGRLTQDRKAYEAVIALGSRTDTDDAQGTVVRTAPVPERLAHPAVAGAVVASLVGDQEQVPPAFSAVSVNGRRSYALAREGNAPELAPRPVTVYRAELLGSRRSGDQVLWTCAFEVSKGCYIRALARDLGEDLGCGGHLCGLRRTASGRFGEADAVSLEALEKGGLELARTLWRDPVDALGLPVRQLSAAELEDARNGKRLPAGAAPDAPLVALVHGTRLYGVWHQRAGVLSCDLNLVRGVEGVRDGGRR